MKTASCYQIMIGLVERPLAFVRLVGFVFALGGLKIRL